MSKATSEGMIEADVEVSTAAVAVADDLPSKTTPPTDTRRCCNWFGHRHVITIFSFLSISLGYAQRVNLSIAIVAMTDRNATLESDSQYFDWDGGTRSAILSSFFWGYVITQYPIAEERFLRGVLEVRISILADIWENDSLSLSSGLLNAVPKNLTLTLLGDRYGYTFPEKFPEHSSGQALTISATARQIPSGQLAERFGPKMVLAVGMGLCSFFTLLSPVAASGGWEWLCASRVIQGLGQGVLFPSTHALLARWSPPSERGRISTFAYAGAQFGTVIALPTGGLLAATRGVGWPSMFYIFGGLGLLWTIAWIIFGASEPDEHRWISESERHYINTALRSQKDHVSPKNLKTPWKSILTSVPFMATLLAHCGQNWGYWTLLTEMPTYMGNVLNYDIKKNGVLSAMPYLAMWIFSIVISWVSDEALEKGWLSVRSARKIGNSIAHWGPAIALIILGYIPNNQPNTALGLLILAVGLNGASFVGFQVNHIDLSPNFAGTLMGITNCVANFMSIIAPLVAGDVAPDSTNADQWRIVFFISAAVYFVFNLLFIIFGSGEIQPWNNPNAMKRESSEEEGSSSSDTGKETTVIKVQSEK